MNKTFEFNTKDRLELREMFYREQSSMANNFIDRIEQIISERITPEPGESGQSAEDVLDQHYKGYLKRIAFPEQVLAAMTTYASQVCADRDARITEQAAELRFRHDRIGELNFEIDRLNESLAVMVRKNDELLKSVRPEVVVPSEEWINGFKEEGRVASNWTIDKIKSLNPTLTFTELNHTAPTGDKSDEG